jgi:hypothetical protein
MPCGPLAGVALQPDPDGLEGVELGAPFMGLDVPGVEERSPPRPGLITAASTSRGPPSGTAMGTTHCGVA